MMLLLLGLRRRRERGGRGRHGLAQDNMLLEDNTAKQYQYQYQYQTYTRPLPRLPPLKKITSDHQSKPKKRV